MSLIFHIVGKDLRRMRAWLVCWGVVLALPILVGIWVLRNEPPRETWKMVANASVFLIGLQILLGYLLTVLLVQEDLVMGTRQFWRTRPIAGGRLLVAKATGIFIVVAGGPILVTLPWWLWCGFGGAELVRAVTEVILVALAIGVPAMLMAALTDSLGRAMLWSVVLFAIAGTGVVIVPSIAKMGMSRDVAVLFARLILAVSVTLAVAALAVVLLYLSRRRAISLSTVAALAIVGWWLTGRSSGTWLASSEPREFNRERATDVQVALHDAFVEPMRSRGRNVRFEQPDQLRVSFAATYPASGLWLQGLGAHQRWTWQDMTFEREGPLGFLHFSVMSPIPGFTWPADDPETEAWQEAVRVRSRVPEHMWKVKGPEGKAWLQSYSLVPSSIAAKMATTSAAYEAKIWLAIVRSDVANEIPFRPGDWQVGSAHRARLSHFGRENSRVVFSVADVTPTSWITYLATEANKGRWFRTHYEGGYILLNRARREFVSVSQNRPAAIVISGVLVRWQSMTMDVLQVRRGDTWVERPGWVEEASLVFVRMKPDAVFSRDVKIDRLPVRR